MICILFIVGLAFIGLAYALGLLADRNSRTGISRWAYYNDDVCEGVFRIGVGIVIITLLIGFLLGFACSTEKAIDEKIAMYEYENARIESVVVEVVSKFVAYETQTFSNAPQEMVLTVSMYPELKSNELVAEQIRIYVENNNAIKALKVEKIDITTAKWWLYFGN